MGNIHIADADQFLWERIEESIESQNYTDFVTTILENNQTNPISKTPLPHRLITASQLPITYSQSILALRDWVISDIEMLLNAEIQEKISIGTTLANINTLVFNAYINHICIQNALQFNRLRIDKRDWYLYRIQSGNDTKTVTRSFWEWRRSQSEALLEIIIAWMSLENMTNTVNTLEALWPLQSLSMTNELLKKAKFAQLS